MRRIPVRLLIMVAGGCATVHRLSPEACGRTAPAGAAQYTPARGTELKGQYRLTIVTPRSNPARVWHATLRLLPNDTLARFYERAGTALQKRHGERPVAGWFQREGTQHRDTADLQDGELRVGCLPVCLDGTPTYYRIGWITSDGFGGRWDIPPLNTIRIAKADARGYYCAIRESLESASPDSSLPLAARDLRSNSGFQRMERRQTLTPLRYPSRRSAAEAERR